MKASTFGEVVPGYEIRVLNEREIRAAAGMLFVLMLIAIQRVIYTWDFQLLKYASTFFLADFIIRVFVSPRLSPTLILGRLAVRSQTPEYVGATQKKFAWIIGLVLGSVMVVMLNVLNLHSPITGIICFICQIFLFLESAFGICLGCKVYPLLYGKQARYCPGEVCELKDRQPIQKTSRGQLIMLVAFAAVFAAAVFPLREHYARKPVSILGVKEPAIAGQPQSGP